MIDLVWGSNSYVGINLTKGLEPATSFLVSKSTNDSLNQDFPFILHDFCLKPFFIDKGVKRLFILARSESDQTSDQVSFYDHLGQSVKALVKDNPGIEIHFLSSTLVYSSNENKAYDLNTRPAPEALYERQKLDFEDYLVDLNMAYSKMSLFIYRIPLLIGGVLREKDRGRQLFYAFYDGFKQGHFWAFPKPEQREMGTAWLDVAALCSIMLKPEEQAGRVLYLPYSGNLSYYEFMRAAHQSLAFRFIEKRSLAPQSYMFINSPDLWGQAPFWSIF